MSYKVKLEVFEGPFDLLFHLIEKSKVDIYNIPIAKITEQYLQYIEDMEKIDLEVASEFLVMAATLIEIKSKMLLPNKEEEQLSIEIDDEDPRQDLVKKLVEYKKYKKAAIAFKERETLYKTFYKPQEQIDQYVKYDTKEIENLNMDDLMEAFNHFLKKRKKIKNKAPINVIVRETITLEERIKEIKDSFHKGNSLEFEELFLRDSNKNEMIVTFLALLELIKLKYLKVQQSETFGAIIVEKIIVGDEVQ